MGVITATIYRLIVILLVMYIIGIVWVIVWAILIILVMNYVDRGLLILHIIVMWDTSFLRVVSLPDSTYDFFIFVLKLIDSHLELLKFLRKVNSFLMFMHIQLIFRLFGLLSFLRLLIFSYADIFFRDHLYIQSVYIIKSCFLLSLDMIMNMT